MKGRLEKRSKSSWTIVIEAGRDPSTGRRNRVYRSVRGNKTQAKQEMERILAELQQGTYVRSDRTTVAEYLRQWVKTYCEPNLAKSTVSGYSRVMEKHVIPEVGRIPLQDLQPVHLQALYARLLEKGLAARMAQLTHAVLHEALRHAMLWQLLPRNPADAVQAPRPQPKEARALTAAEASSLLAKMEGHKDYTIMYLALHTGMRRGEILGLRWSDVDLEHQVISVDQALIATGEGLEFSHTKTRKSRRAVPISEEVCCVLRQHRKRQLEQRLAAGPRWQDHDMVFPDETGRPQHPSSFSQRFGYAMKALGLKGLRFHDLRHTHASLLLAAGVHPKVVQERLGHTLITTTMDIYSHLTPTLQREAADAIDGMLSPNRRHSASNEARRTPTTTDKTAAQ